MRAAETVKPPDQDEQAEKARLEPFSLMEGRMEFVQRRRLKLKKQLAGATTADKEVDHDAEDMKRAAKRQALAVPPPGMYNPKLVDRHIQGRLYKEAHVSKVKARPFTAAPGGRQALSRDDLEFAPDKPHRYITGYVALKPKTNRRPLTAGRDVVDEEGKQFEYRDIPRTSSRYRYWHLIQTGQFLLNEEVGEQKRFL
jgi:hypothetical protein